MRIAVFAAVVIWASPALAEIPHFDVEGRCDEVAGFGGTYSNAMFNFCINAEQDAYDALKAYWASLPPTIQEHCKEIATFGSPGSYEMLKFCVDEERDAGSNRSTFQR